MSTPDGPSPAAGEEVYSSSVTKIGEQVAPFLGHGLLIFFGEDAPEELHEMSVLHRPTTTLDGPQPGDTLYVGEEAMEVLAVGDVVRDNLLSMGHLDLKADGRTRAKLPGDVCVRAGDIPLLSPGDSWRIVRGPGYASTGDSQ